ncbi:hypothetical protein LX73_0444 [Fodinibius salinus]|uniref:Outer membrane protein beta-barrel domain-containing protein n=1 Tax=Fodinibius salinus TaxID=860790 RepID=A0A5D3YQ24_9BACT|nr:hypothetical protein [Fodinibius salinus]TYP95149.1 hypothetical protein LX73_0444 [Fodinibius salinus]
MKKLLTYGWLILGFTLFSAYSTNAQDNMATSYPFQEGDLVINAGIGLGATYSTFGGGGLGLPLGAGAEYGVADLETGIIGVGGDFGFISGSGVSILYIGGKGSYHFNELLELGNDNLDLYGGLGLYYRNYSFSNSFVSSNVGSGMVAAFHLGARYYFSEQLGAYAELGNNWGWLNIGVAFKL